MNKSEPPSTESPVPNIFLVGRDSHGHWVVQDERGLCGGLFVDRNYAIRFAMDETGQRPHAIKMVSDVIELDMSRPARSTRPQIDRYPDAARAPAVLSRVRADRRFDDPAHEYAHAG